MFFIELNNEDRVAPIPDYSSPPHQIWDQRLKRWKFNLISQWLIAIIEIYKKGDVVPYKLCCLAGKYQGYINYTYMI